MFPISCSIIRLSLLRFQWCPDFDHFLPKQGLIVQKKRDYLFRSPRNLGSYLSPSIRLPLPKMLGTPSHWLVLQVVKSKKIAPLYEIWMYSGATSQLLISNASCHESLKRFYQSPRNLKRSPHPHHCLYSHGMGGSIMVRSTIQALSHESDSNANHNCEHQRKEIKLAGQQQVRQQHMVKMIERNAAQEEWWERHHGATPEIVEGSLSTSSAMLK